MKKPGEMSVFEIRDAISSKKISSVEILNDFISKIRDDDLNIFITKTYENAKKQAEESDKRFKTGDQKPLDGVVFGVKDLFCTNGIRTTSASAMLEDFVPFYESDVTAKLFQNGAISLGKINMDEFAMGSTGKNSYFGATINPHRSKLNPSKKLVPGGSSSASAAIVAAKMASASLGSDTGGSIRQPAAFCGIVGVKPTYGTCSRYGMIAFGSSFDQAGVFANSVEESAYILDCISGKTKNDSIMINKEKYNFHDNLLKNKSVKGMKIGVPIEFKSDKTMPDINAKWEESIKALEKLGCEIIDISLKNAPLSINLYYIISIAELSSNLAMFDGIRFTKRIEDGIENISDIYTKTRGKFFGKEAKRRIMIGTAVLSSGNYDDYYLRAMKVRTKIINQFSDAFQKVDVILCPTTPTTAFGIDDDISDPVQMYLNDVYTVPVNIAGLPGISVPCGLSSDGLPIGMQVIADRFQDDKMFAIANALESCFKS